ncbi:MAG: hypothetical protein WD049_09165 [Candidatus Paceibacterota bacterium]
MSKNANKNKNKKHTKKNAEKEQRNRKWRQEKATIKEFRAKAPHMKALLRSRGCDLPFYDYLDSYSEEFHRTVEAAKAAYPSLLGVHEVDDQTFAAETQEWSQFGYSDLEQVFFKIEDTFADYGSSPLDANLCGSMSAFHDSAGNVRSVILIRRSVQTSVQHHELKYAFKIISLVHEIGHVEDLERGINFDVPSRHLDVIAAEAYAHLFALERLARRNLVQSFNTLVDGLRDSVSADGYISKVAQQVLERLPEYQLTHWQEAFDIPPTNEEARQLGPKTMRILSQ